MLQTNNSPQLAAYVVWVPELGATVANVAAATALVPDQRATHYWDAHERLGKRYGQALSIDGPAWDVYLLYPPGAVWRGEQPPYPSFWMQQLAGVRNAPHLDAREFAARASALLGPAQNR